MTTKRTKAAKRKARKTHPGLADLPAAVHIEMGDNGNWRVHLDDNLTILETDKLITIHADHRDNQRLEIHGRHYLNYVPDEEIEAANRKKLEQIAKRQDERAPQVLGFSATSVLRWMGKSKWTAEQALAAFEALLVRGYDRNDAQEYLSQGRIGQGDIADLTNRQAAYLKLAGQ